MVVDVSLWEELDCTSQREACGFELTSILVRRCGSLQAYSLVGGDRRLHLTPRRLNALFLGVLTVVGVTMLVSPGRRRRSRLTKSKG